MPSRTLESQDEIKEALAVLIASTRNRSRPLSLVQIAKWLDRAVISLGSYDAVASRIGLSSKMLRQFSNVKKLSNDVQRLFETRSLDSVDAATHLAMLPEKEQKLIAKELVAKTINTADIRAVIQLREAGVSGPIRKLLSRVVDSKTTKEYVAEFVIRGNRPAKDILKAFSTYVPSNDIIDLEVDGSIGRIRLSPSGKQSLAKACRKLGVPMKHVIPAILR